MTSIQLYLLLGNLAIGILALAYCFAPRRAHAPALLVSLALVWAALVIAPHAEASTGGLGKTEAPLLLFFLGMFILIGVFAAFNAYYYARMCFLVTVPVLVAAALAGCDPGPSVFVTKLPEPNSNCVEFNHRNDHFLVCEITTASGHVCAVSSGYRKGGISCNWGNGDAK